MLCVLLLILLQLVLVKVCQEFIVGALAIQQGIAADLDDPVGNGLHELVVVGGKENGLRVADQAVVQGGDGLLIQVVGGFVQHQHIGAGEHHLAQHTPHPLAAGKYIGFL